MASSPGTPGDWVRYWRDDARPIEAMHAHFRSHVYHRHSHDSYSFGVTESGAQAFTCRGGRHVSSAGMIMTFNPDDPHDGHAATGGGFTYRMIHIDPGLVTSLLADVTGRPAGRPLFSEPVATDPRLAGSLQFLFGVLTGPSTPLEKHDRLLATVTALTRHTRLRGLADPLADTGVLGGAGVLAGGSSAPGGPGLTALTGPPGTGRRGSGRAVPAALRMRDLLHDAYASPLTADDLAAAAGCSRYAAYRAFSAAFGLAPSDYQRQLRLRAARRLLGEGRLLAQAAATAGFADQAHLTRWFRRYYGVTPGAYQRATHTGLNRQG